MAQSFKLCPICGTPSHRNATLCSTCGTSLADVEVVKDEAPVRRGTPQYSYQYGETDLFEGALRRRGQVYVFSGLLVVALILCAGIGFFVGSGLLTRQPTPTPESATAVPIFGSQPELAVTNTPRPTIILATVTPAPPTPTPTPTQGPCTVRVEPGSDLISMAWSCGHRSLDVIPLILEMNDLDAPEQVQAGQEILIPWPTDAANPESAPADGSGSDDVTEETGAENAAAGFADDSSAVSILSAPTSSGPTVAPTETLLPGVMWHEVRPNQSMSEIVFTYNTSAETLSQLNPEISFSQCDFGSVTGGDTCIVMLYAGQRIRVPAPTPTPTLSPTLSGSETPTPTLTPTFNAPTLLSPADRVLFLRNDLITLRWVATGTLDADEVYRVRVEDLTANLEYAGETTELYFTIPVEWQGQDNRRHDYRWSVSVIRRSSPDQPIYTTDARLFTWEGRN